MSESDKPSPHSPASEEPSAAEDSSVIASWENDSSTAITLQNFVAGGETFIPMFSDIERFRIETAGSGYEHKSVQIRKDFLRQILQSEELLILNPGSDEPRRLGKIDLWMRSAY